MYIILFYIENLSQLFANAYKNGIVIRITETFFVSWHTIVYSSMPIILEINLIIKNNYCYKYILYSLWNSSRVIKNRIFIFFLPNIRLRRK